MKVTNFRFQNFKSLRDVSFQPGRVNVFIGPNGSGKTSLLEAIGVCSAGLSYGVYADNCQKRGIRISNLDLYQSRFPGAVENNPSILVDWDWTDNQPTGSGSGLDTFSCGVELNLYETTWIAEGLTFQRNHDLLFDSKNVQLPPDSQNSKGILSLTLAQQYFSFRHADLNYIRNVIVRMKSQLFSDDSDNDPDFTSKTSLLAFANIYPFLIPYAIYQPTTPILRGTIADPSQTEPLGLNGGRLAEAVEDLTGTDSGGNPRFGSLEMGELMDLIDWMDDFIITHFTKGAGVDTLSTKIYSEIRKGIKPEMYALSTLIFFLVIFLLLLVQYRASSQSDSRK